MNRQEVLFFCRIETWAFCWFVTWWAFDNENDKKKYTKSLPNQAFHYYLYNLHIFKFSSLPVTQENSKKVNISTHPNGHSVVINCTVRVQNWKLLIPDSTSKSAKSNCNFISWIFFGNMHILKQIFHIVLLTILRKFKFYRFGHPFRRRTFTTIE